MSIVVIYLFIYLFIIESCTKHKRNVIYNTVQRSVPANKYNKQMLHVKRNNKIIK